MRTIWHHGAWNRNFGDWVLFDSIQHHLVRAHGGPLRFLPVDSQKTIYVPDIIDRINDEADLLLVGGGGLLFHRPEDDSSSGWQFNIRHQDLERLRVPLIVYGVGYNRFPHDHRGFPEVFAAHLRAVQERAALFSVRNHGTRAALLDLGLSGSAMEVVADAGIFAPVRPLQAPALDGEGPLIGVNIAGDRPEHRWPPPAAASAHAALEALAAGLARLCDRVGARVVLIPHLVEIDEVHDQMFTEIIGAQRVSRLRHAAPWLYPPGPVGAPFLAGVYDRCDLVVGMRGHACLIPFGRRRRFVTFGSHAKNRFLLEDAGLVGACIAAESAAAAQDPEGRAVEKVLLAVLQDETWEGRAGRALEDMEARFHAFNRRVVETIQRSRRTA